MDLIPSPSPSLTIQILGKKVMLLHLKKIFLTIILIFTEGEGIESRLLFKTFPTLFDFTISQSFFYEIFFKLMGSSPVGYDGVFTHWILTGGLSVPLDLTGGLRPLWI